MTQEIPPHPIDRTGQPPVAPVKAGMTTTTTILLAVGAAAVVLAMLCCVGAVVFYSASRDAKPGATVRLSPPPVAAAPAASPTPDSSPTPEISPTPPVYPADRTYSGKGSKVVKLAPLDEEFEYMAKFTHTGSSNFMVTLRGAGGDYQDLLVNAIGRYAGTRPLTTRDHPSALEINADGSWKVVIQSLHKAPRWDGSLLKGKGAAVYLVPPGTLSGLATARFTHTGRWNVAVWTHGPSSHDLVVNAIGRYSGEVVLDSDTTLLEITADGAWTIQKT